MIWELLVIVIVIAVVYFMFKKKPLKNRTKSNYKKDEEVESNDMVECSACGTYSELSDTIISNNKYFCCQECVEKS